MTKHFFDFFRSSTIASIIVLLSGCANIPDLGPLLHPRNDLTISNQLQEDINEADVIPQYLWWDKYGDDQLSSLISLGLNQSFSLAEARARILAAQGNAQKIGAKLWPVIGADASIQKSRQSYNNGIPADFVTKGFNDTGRGVLTFDYELDFWGKNKKALEASISEVRATELEERQAKIILTTSIASTYANLARLYNELDAAEKTVKVRKKTLELFSDRYRNGLENNSVIESSKSNLSLANADVASIEEAIDLTKNALTSLLGSQPDKAIKITRPSLKIMTTIKTPTEINVDLIARRPDVQASILRIKAMNKWVDIARIGFYPNINLSAFIGQQSLGLDSFFKNGSLIGSVGPAIHLPIFESTKLAGYYRSARAKYNQAIAQYNNTIVTSLREVADAVTSQKYLASRIKSTKAAVNNSKKAYDLIRKRYTGGLATYLEVLRAEDQLIASRRSLATLNTRAFTLDIALIKALGGGYQQDKDQNKSGETK